jgi:serine/threonine-protein kinase
MYLYYVLPAIEQGKFSDGTLDELPQGLEEYYNRHWRQMQQIDGKENFAKIYEPIVYTFGVVKEPVSIELIGYFTRLAERDVRNAINCWREFLDEQMINGTRRYRIYHSSFQEFLRDKTNLKEYHKIFAKKRLEDLRNLGILKEK